jgi:large subunit ribosomal protein L3
MLHVMGVNKHKGSPFNNQKVAIPATVLEVPGITILGVRFYGKSNGAKKALKDFLFTSKASKHISKRITGMNRAKEKGDLLKSALEFFEANKAKVKELVLIAQTHPEKTTIGKKAPEVIELYLSGKPEEQLEFFKSKVGQDLDVSDFANESTFVDVKGVTVGKGFQGVIKRFGVKRLHHKSEKGVRGVGSIGAWHPATVNSTVPRPGQMGYHNRVQSGQKILKYLESTAINPKGGWEGYGVVKNKAVIVAGSVPGHVKRLVALRNAERKPKHIKTDISEITSIVIE